MKSSRSAVYVPGDRVYWIFTGRSFHGGMAKSVRLTVNTGSRSLSTAHGGRRRHDRVVAQHDLALAVLARRADEQLAKVEPVLDAVTCRYLPIAERRMLASAAV